MCLLVATLTFVLAFLGRYTLFSSIGSRVTFSTFLTGLAIGAVALVTGLVILLTSSETRRRLLAVHIEGESYKAGLGKDETAAASTAQVNRVAVVSDAHVTVAAGVTDSAKDGRLKWVRERDARNLVQHDFSLLEEEIEKLLPTFALPRVG